MDWFICSAEWWLNRYQTLLVGLLAVALAYRQAKTMRQQTEITMTQIKQDKAIAMLTVAAFMDKVKPFADINMMVSFHPWMTDDGDRHVAWKMDETTMPALEKDWDSAAVRAAAVKGYPDLAAQISDAVEQADQTAAALAEFRRSPSTAGFFNLGDMTEVERDANIAVNRMVRAYSELSAAIRSQQAA